MTAASGFHAGSAGAGGGYIFAAGWRHGAVCVRCHLVYRPKITRTQWIAPAEVSLGSFFAGHHRCRNANWAASSQRGPPSLQGASPIRNPEGIGGPSHFERRLHFELALTLIPTANIDRAAELLTPPRAKPS